MKTPKQMWLVYSPVERYESSEVPHLICPDEVTAAACKDTINNFINRLAGRLPSISSDLDDAVYFAKIQKKNAMLDKAKWPYGIRFDEYDLSEFGKVVQIKALPFKGAV